MPILDTTYRSRLTNRYQAETFWAQYDIPFECSIAIKGRETTMSKLDDDAIDVDQSVSGVGFTPNTALHLVCDEGFKHVHDGAPISRDAGEFLCNGEGDMPITGLVRADTLPDGDAVTYVPPVTCYTCLRRLKRWRVRDAALAPVVADSKVNGRPLAPSPGGAVTATDGGTSGD